MENNRKSNTGEIVLEVVLLIICWVITNFFMLYVWHSESGLVKFLTLVVLYAILYFLIALVRQKLHGSKASSDRKSSPTSKKH